MFPLSLLSDNLPAPWGGLIEANPLKYLAYYPAAVFLGKVPADELWTGIGIQALWTLFFVVACRVGAARRVQSVQWVWGIDP